MQKNVPAILGVVLILVGLFTLSANFLLSMFGIRWWEPWRFWPLVVQAVGAFLTLLALLSIKQRGWGTLFIPAAPISMTGTILLFASVFNMWHIWSFAWAFIILALAMGFVLAAVFARIYWLSIPAVIIGLNGLALTFCAVTGMWGAWSVLWAIEPLAIGLVLLLVAYKSRSLVVGILGLVFSGFAGLAFALMSGALLWGNWMFSWTGPAMLMLLGGLILGLGLLKRPVDHMNM